MKYTVVILIVLVCSFLAIFIASKKWWPQRNSNDFIVGIATGYAPFISINAQGEYEGFDIDIAQEIGRIMHKNVVFKDLGSMTPLFLALQQGNIDAIMWGLSITKERLKQVAMITYQGEQITSYPLIFWNKVPQKVHGIDDMQHMTICVEPASSQENVLKKYPFVQLLLTDKVDDALFNIQYGKADAALLDPAIAKKFKTKYPNIASIEIPLEPEDQVQGVGIAFRQNDTVLVAKVQKAINQLQKSGVIKEYETKWELA